MKVDPDSCFLKLHTLGEKIAIAVDNRFERHGQMAFEDSISPFCRPRDQTAADMAGNMRSGWGIG